MSFGFKGHTLELLYAHGREPGNEANRRPHHLIIIIIAFRSRIRIAHLQHNALLRFYVQRKVQYIKTWRCGDRTCFFFPCWQARSGVAVSCRYTYTAGPALVHTPFSASLQHMHGSSFFTCTQCTSQQEVRSVGSNRIIIYV